MAKKAGHLPITLDGSFYKEGKVGADVTVDEANEAAKWVALNIISTIKGGWSPRSHSRCKLEDLSS